MRPIVLPIVAAAALAGIAPGCGGDGDGLPDDAVAKVGDAVVTKADYEAALRFAAGRDNDPRDYAACAEAKRQAAGDDGNPPGKAELEAQCREEYEQIKSNVMDYLLKAEWTRQEADARGIVVTDARVEKVLDRAQQFGLLDPDAARSAGISEEDLLGRVRYNQLHAQVSQQMRDEAEVSDEDIADYYRRNKSKFVVPYRRRARIVITRTRARAQAAKAELSGGRSWASVSREYSVHFSRNDGGRISATWKRPDRAGFGAALFQAPTGELTGPVQKGDTWAVFSAARLERSRQATLDQVRAEITRRLQPKREKQALVAYTKRYRDKTTCAPGFKVAACKNGRGQTAAEPSG
jgi:parvulin-like peptidyl-prolyl isomerase